MDRDNYIVCTCCGKAFCVSANHPNVLLLFLHDHHGHNLTYVREDHPAMEGCDVYLEYLFHDPQPAFHLPAPTPME